ncbi:MAG: hypothetical protein R2726_04715 [Acidimicrobiales bacterium]
MLAKGTESLVLDHYLEVLRLKPGALPGATALARARASGAFSADHEDVLVRGPPTPQRRRRTQALIEVLLAAGPARRRRARRDPSGATDPGSVDPAIVVVGARRALEDHDARSWRSVIARYDRPPPTIAHYDQLLEAR